MPAFEPKRTDYLEAVNALLAQMPLAIDMGIELTDIRPGRVVAELKLKPEITQQHGFAHAGTLATLADTVCGLAAYSLMPEGAGVMSVNINLSLMRPGKGRLLRGEGRVVKAGNRVYFTEADIYAVDETGEKLAIKVTATMTAV